MTTAERLIYLPLGGAGEIGMNAYVYGYGAPGRERLILVECGVTFPDMDTTPGVDLIFADIAWLADRADRLEAIFITHAHEDHVGALGHLWGRLKAPVYCRRFTSIHAARKMEEHGHDPAVIRTIAPWPETVQAGPFSVAFLPVSHSIPEASGMVIESPAGRVLHTGDFKLDPTPGVGEPWQPELWKQAAGDLQALVCDSTNVFVEHPGRSEATLITAISDLVARQPGRVVATTFASNVARLRTMAQAGHAAGRQIVVLGAAMRRMIAASVEAGVLTDFPPTIPPEEARGLSREKLMMLVSGSQGERRAASAQLAQGRYQGLSLSEGDLFLFSSRTIPGNERGVIRVINQLSEMGVDVVDDATDLYHVSGHANRPDLAAVHRLLSPRMVVPMHGEHRHLRAHEKLAGEAGIPAITAPNGTMLDLTGEAPRVIERIEAGRLYLDGAVHIGARDGVVRDRIRLALNGLVVVSLLIEDDGTPLGPPWVDLRGLPETTEAGTPWAEGLEDALDKLVTGADKRTRRDDDKLGEVLKKRVHSVALAEIGRKPEVLVIVSRLDA